MNKKSFIVVFFVYVLAFCVFSFANAETANKAETKPEVKAETKTEAKTEAAATAESKDKAEKAPADGGAKKGKVKKMFAIFEIEIDGKSIGKIKAKLFHKLVPNTVDNFVGLAEGTKEFTEAPGKPKAGEKVTRHYYDGTIFHRVIPGFMIQGGDPTGTGRGGPGYSFKDEFQPSLRHDKKGILSMANSGPNTNGSQFFITLVPTPHLDDKHSVFGEVVEGMDVVEKIGAVKRGAQDRPEKDVVMKKVTIEKVY